MKTLIIDTSYLMYRSHFAYPNLTHNELPVGAFFGFVKTTLAMIKDHNPDQIIFAGDTPKATWRHKVVDDYKAGRAPIEQSLVDQIPIINEWCRLVSQNSFWVEGWEADDIIFSTTVEILTDFKGLFKTTSKKKESTKLLDLFDSEPATDSTQNNFVPTFEFEHSELLNQTSENNNRILIFSADKDLYQILTLPRVSFLQTQKQVGENFTRTLTHNPKELVEFNSDDFESKYNLKPCQWLDYKALVGDGGDNLKGVEGIGPKTATEFLQSVGSLYGFFDYVEKNRGELSKTFVILENIDNRVFLRSCNFDNKAEIGELFSSPKKQVLIQKLINNFEIIKKTYELSALHQVPQTKLSMTGFDLHSGIELLQQYGFKSLVSSVNSLSPAQSDQESLF
jgi:DNA polymerase I